MLEWLTNRFPRNINFGSHLDPDWFVSAAPAGPCSADVKIMIIHAEQRGVFMSQSVTGVSCTMCYNVFQELGHEPLKY